MKRFLIFLLSSMFVCSPFNAQPQASPQPTKPLWQTKLSVLETDFIEFISKDRILVGTLDDASAVTEFKPHEVMLLNAATGATIWAVPRASFGLPQTLEAVSPVILLNGSKQYAALNPDTGVQIWSREHTGEQPLLLGSQDRVIFLDRKSSPLSLSALDVKTGAEVWKTAVENYPEDRSTMLNVASVGNAVLLNGPEVVALSATDGKLLWRIPFPATYGPKAKAVPLGGDLYFSDGTAITRTDPASGKQIWRAPVTDGAFVVLTASERAVFVLLKGGGDDPPHSILALDRAAGAQLWKYDLEDRAASPLTVLADRLYVTTPGHVIALDALNGGLVFKTEIPERLGSRHQLPDQLQITRDRVIVAREDGVLAVQKADGKLLFADEAVGGKGFTYGYVAHRDAPPSAYRGLGPYEQAEMAMQMNTIKQATSSQVPGQAAQYYAPRAATAGYAAVGGIYAYAAVMGVITAEREAVDAQIRLQQTVRTHVHSLQSEFYVRPVYEEGRGSSLHVVNPATGEHADIFLSPDQPDLKSWKSYDPEILIANLPAFSADGSRIVAKGLGENPEFLEQHRGFLVKMVLAFPSVLTFDAASLHFEPAKPLTPLSKNPSDEQLLVAALKGDGETIKKLLASGANVNARDEYGRTPLMLAAKAGALSRKTDAVKLLLDRGADAELKDAGGWSAYEYACAADGAAKGMPAQQALGEKKLIVKAQHEHK